MSDTQIQRLLDLIQADHPSACDVLLHHTLERLRCVAAQKQVTATSAPLSMRHQLVASLRPANAR